MVAAGWRRVVGLTLLATTVTLWTASGFLASSIFADATFSKPYFVSYFNIAFFILPLLFHVLRQSTSNCRRRFSNSHGGRRRGSAKYSRLEEAGHERRSSDDEYNHSVAQLDRLRSHDSLSSESPLSPTLPPNPKPDPLTTRETAALSLRFSVLWFICCYFNAASLQYTTVASSTILSSTSSVFTLILGALYGIERFTWRKALAVVTTLLGVFIISRADTASRHDAKNGAPSRNEGTFPHKTPAELAVGDAMALTAAACYGVYAIAFVKSAGDEGRVKMPLFFGFIGVFVVALLWPGFAILHWAGIEPFGLPETPRIWTVVVLNALASLVADMSWAYALCFISPLVVTVGLSLTIPLSLVGQMVIFGQFKGWVYWLGALVVLGSFVFVTYESGEAKDPTEVSGENGDGYDQNESRYA